MHKLFVLYVVYILFIGNLEADIFDFVKSIYNEPLMCHWGECCHPYSKWMPINFTKLEGDIKTQLFGQHLVEVALLKLFKYHVESTNPNKALLLSFNGMTGTGKNYASTILVNSLFKNGMKSKFVHLYSSGHHFPIFRRIDNYRADLKRDIIEYVKQCPRSVFIFDEVHDMPPTLIDVLKPFVDSHEVLDGVDFRKSIFILLSNSGGKNINTIVTEVFKNGRERESLTMMEVEEIMAKNLYTMKNDGLRKSKLIEHNLISAFVPFLPLEKRHVKLCIIHRYAGKERLTERNIDNIIEHILFENIDGFLLAKKGCKDVDEKIRLLL